MLACLMAFLFASVFTDFPGGSIGSAKWVAEDHLQIAVKGQADHEGRNRQANWYFFRVDGYPAAPLRIELTDLVGEYNYRPGTHAVDQHTHPVYSYDGITWTHFPQVEWDARQIRLSVRFAPQRSPFWIAHTPPYTEREFRQLEADLARHPMLERRSVGKSVEGREVPLWTITDPAVPQSRKRTIWLMFRQHAWESGSSWVAEGALRFLLSQDETAAALRREVTWKIFPLCDPDGVYHGEVRYNRNGYDLNRNWDAIDPAKTPEIAAQHAAIRDWLAAGNRIDYFLSLHNTETGEYLEGPAKHRPAIDRLRTLLLAETTFRSTRDRLRDAAPSTDPQRKGRMSVNQGLFAEFGICAMLMEQMVAYNDKLGRLPSIEDRQSFGRDLVQTMAKALR